MANDEAKRLQEQADAIIRKEGFEEGRSVGFEEGWKFAMKQIQSLTLPTSNSAESQKSKRIPLKPHQAIRMSAPLLAMPRGTTDVVVRKVLRSSGEALSPKMVMLKAAQTEGLRLSESAVHRSLRKLAELGQAEQVEGTVTWRAK